MTTPTASSAAARARRPRGPARVLPLLVALVGAAGTAGLWAALTADQDRRLHRVVQFELAHVQRTAQDRLPQEIGKVAELAERWPRADPDEMKMDVGAYVGQRPACLGVARVGPDRTFDWVESRSEPTRPLRALGGGAKLEAAIARGEAVAVRVPRSGWRGMRVLLVFAPHRPGAADGGLVAVWRVQELFDTLCNANVAAGYAVTIVDGEDVLFGRYTADQSHRARWGQTLPLRFGGHEWKVTVWPTADAMARESLSLPRFALLIGLLMSALLALAVHLAQTARWRAGALEREARERESAQLALARSEVQYRTLIENLGQGIFLQDRDGRYVAANAQFCHSLGRAEGDVIGATAADLYPPAEAGALAAEIEAVFAHGRSAESEYESTADGRPVCVRRVLTPVRDAAGAVTGVLGICWDVTEQRRLEAHVNQASKMDAIGQLAGGIAHDFNNLLTAILGNLELLRADPDDPDHELVARAREAAVRAASLTQRLLGFSRRHQLDWRPTDLNTLSVEVVSLLRRTIDPLIRIETNLSPDLWPVLADPTQLNQVLMNLCLNARDAIDGPGTIAVETDRVSCPDRRDGKGGAARGEFVRLRVSDTGGGMTAEVKARMFEPFFTTKAVGKGTGLGLPMVFAIVRQHKGWIECHSEVGRGTRFDIFLPRGEGSKAHVALPAKPEAHRGQGTVLVVDDEELIRRLAAMTLERAGYRVVQAADGQQAVDAYTADADHIDLVLLDLTMPVLSGHETFRQLLAINPRARVVFASGYAEEQLSESEQRQMAGFVKKPYRPTDLVQAVAAALEKGARVDTPTPLPPSLSSYRLTTLR